jgi:hypothetical protein
MEKPVDYVVQKVDAAYTRAMTAETTGPLVQAED